MTNSMPAEPVPIATDGGWAWMVVIGSFLAYFIVDGWSYSFGVFYPELLGYFKEGNGKTALVGALLYGTPMVISPVVCALTAVYGCRRIAILGGVITGLSFVVSAFATSVNFLCFSTGILASIGLAFTYIPAIFSVTFHFERRRGLATGLAVTGSGLGAFAFPPLMDLFLERYAWRGMLLIFGGICFNIMAAGGLFWPPRMGYPANEDVDATSDKEPEGAHIKCTSSNVLMPRLHNRQPSRNKSGSVIMLHTITTERNRSCLDLDQVSPPCPLDEAGHQQMILQDADKDPRAAHWASSPDLYIDREQTLLQCEPLTDTEIKNPKCGHKFVTELQTLIKTMLDKTLLHNFTYLLFVGHGFIMFLWIGVPYVYLVDYASMSADISSSKASFLLSYIAIGRIVGMPALGWIGDNKRVNVILLYAVCTIGCGVATVCIPFCTNYESLVVCSVIFGFCISSSYVLTMMILVEIVGLEKSSGAFGIFQLVLGIATLLGTPVAGTTVIYYNVSVSVFFNLFQQTVLLMHKHARCENGRTSFYLPKF